MASQSIMIVFMKRTGFLPCFTMALDSTGHKAQVEGEKEHIRLQKRRTKTIVQNEAQAVKIDDRQDSLFVNNLTFAFKPRFKTIYILKLQKAPIVSKALNY
ncbi:uncharacterized protein LOC141860213 isoform X2 [Acropora palmata]|uniref:uncharacterized protein LOC141860213 isoform X2 n=1 Tax=Acropora palmata TaxID=6131 RepID=UPI003DA0139C